MKEISIISFLIVLFLQYLGVLKHYLNLKSSKRTNVSFWTYLIYGDKYKQGAKLFGIWGSTLLTCSAGVGDWVNPEIIYRTLVYGHTINIEAFIMAGLFIGAGYTFDSNGNNMDNTK